MFKKIEINIPFVEAIAQMPLYTKFMKDILRKKRKFDEEGVVSLTANLQCNDLEEFATEDAGSRQLHHSLHHREFWMGKALCDFGVSINLMPLSIVKRLSFGELTPIAMTLQMEDRTLAQPEGILEDVLIKVGKFIFPMDFMVIDIEEDKQVPLLLGRPFLTTRTALIDVKKGELTLRMGDEAVHFNLNQSLKQLEFYNSDCKTVETTVPISSKRKYDC